MWYPNRLRCQTYAYPHYSTVGQRMRTDMFCSGMDYRLRYDLKYLGADDFNKLRTMVRSRVGTSVLGGLGHLFWVFHGAMNAEFCANIDSNKVVVMHFPNSDAGMETADNMREACKPYTDLLSGHLGAVQTGSYRMAGWGMNTLTMNLGNKQDKTFIRNMLYQASGTDTEQTAYLLHKLDQKPCIEVRHWSDESQFADPDATNSHGYRNPQTWMRRSFHFVD